MAEIASRTTAKPVSTRRIRILRHILAENLWALSFLSLSLIGLIVLTAIPIVASFYLSFTDWDALSTPNFVGLDNFVKLANDPTFLHALWNTVYFTLVSVPVGMILSLALALALNRKLRGMGLFRTLFMMPVMASTVATALLWGLLLDPYIGLANYLLQAVGLP